MHAKDGIKMALRDHAKFHDMFDELKPLTQAMYGLMGEAIRHCGLNEMEERVLAYRYVTPHDPAQPVLGAADVIGVSRDTVMRYSESLTVKITDYMNERGEDYYERHYIRL